MIAWKKEGMPPDLNGAVAWVRRNKPIAGDGDTIAEYKKNKLKHEARHKELDVLVMEGKLIDSEEPIWWIGAEVDAAKNGFRALPVRLPGMLEGKPARDMEPIIRDEVDTILRKLADSEKRYKKTFLKGRR